MKLHTPKQREKGKRWYCGVFAYSVLTGASFEESRRRINHVRGMKENTGVRGVSTDYLLKALTRAGLRTKLRFSSAGYDNAGLKPPTLNSWLKELSKDDDSIYLVEVTHHFVVCQGRSKLIDNHTKHPVSAFMAPWQKKSVKKVYRIEETAS